MAFLEDLATLRFTGLRGKFFDNYILVYILD